MDDLSFPDGDTDKPGLHGYIIDWFDWIRVALWKSVSHFI